MHDIGGVVALIAFGTIGVVCLMWPHRIQEFALGYYARHPFQARLNPWLKWMSTPGYVLSLRLIGAMALGAAVIVGYALVKTW